MIERLQKIYNDEIAPALREEFKLSNVMEVPKVTKIVINVGVGKYKEDKKKIESVMKDIAAITGQQPIQTRARKSIAGFKVRENQIVGLTCTLRGYRMWSFLDKLINISLPRVRDFRGVNADGFDGRGSYHLGLKEQLVFPEISADSLDHTFGLQVSIVTSTKSDDQARSLLNRMNFPFVKPSK